MNARAKRCGVGRQRGASSLFLTVILVLVVMLLALTAAMLSNTQFKLAGNLQFENIAFNLAEGALASAESWLGSGGAGTNAKSAGFETFSTDTPSLYPKDHFATNNLDPLTMTWSNSNSTAVGGDDAQRYMIEKIGRDNYPSGQGLVDNSHQLGGCQKVDVFRISTRGTSAKGTVKFTQTVYSVPSC